MVLPYFFTGPPTFTCVVDRGLVKFLVWFEEPSAQGTEGSHRENLILDINRAKPNFTSPPKFYRTWFFSIRLGAPHRDFFTGQSDCHNKRLVPHCFDWWTDGFPKCINNPESCGPVNERLRQPLHSLQSLFVLHAVDDPPPPPRVSHSGGWWAEGASIPWFGFNQSNGVVSVVVPIALENHFGCAIKFLFWQF